MSQIHALALFTSECKRQALYYLFEPMVESVVWRSTSKGCVTSDAVVATTTLTLRYHPPAPTKTTTCVYGVPQTGTSD